MTPLERYFQIKRKAESARKEADKATGALEQEQKRLKKEFGVATIEAAQHQLKKEEKQRELSRRQFEKEMKRFERKWGDRL